MRRPEFCAHSFKPCNRAKWVRGLICITVLAAIPFTLEVSQGQPYQNGKIAGYPGLPDEINPRPDGIRQMRDAMQAAADLKMLNALNKQRYKEMNEDTAKLIALATELKTNVEKSNVHDVSIAELHRTEQIEKLAKSVREKMRSTLSNNESYQGSK